MSLTEGWGRVANPCLEDSIGRKSPRSLREMLRWVVSDVTRSRVWISSGVGWDPWQQSLGTPVED